MTLSSTVERSVALQQSLETTTDKTETKTTEKKLSQPETTSLDPTPQSSPADIQRRLQLLGSITWLMLQSPLHRHYTVAMLEERILPSLMLDQFRFYEIQGQPVGFLNWCTLSEPVESKFQTGDYELLPQDWQSGDRVWFPEFIAPFGHTQQMARDVRTHIFAKGTIAKALRVNPDGTLRSPARYVL